MRCIGTPLPFKLRAPFCCTDGLGVRLGVRYDASANRLTCLRYKWSAAPLARTVPRSAKSSSSSDLYLLDRPIYISRYKFHLITITKPKKSTCTTATTHIDISNIFKLQANYSNTTQNPLYEHNAQPANSTNQVYSTNQTMHNQPA